MLQHFDNVKRHCLEFIYAKGFGPRHPHNVME